MSLTHAKLKMRRLLDNMNYKEILKKRVPIIEWLPRYTVLSFFRDLLAGFTVSLTAIPQSIALAGVAGEYRRIPPRYYHYNFRFTTPIWLILVRGGRRGLRGLRYLQRPQRRSHEHPGPNDRTLLKKIWTCGCPSFEFLRRIDHFRTRGVQSRSVLSHFSLRKSQKTNKSMHSRYYQSYHDIHLYLDKISINKIHFRFRICHRFRYRILLLPDRIGLHLCRRPRNRVNPSQQLLRDFEQRRRLSGSLESFY